MRFASSLALVATCVLLALSATMVMSKGITGYGRSTGGGYYRYSKVGYYSSRNRYYVTGMYWRSGYSYAYRGPAFRTASGPLTQAQQANLICSRRVLLDNTVPNFGTSITLNSTQRCYSEANTNANSPDNTDITNLMLNRFRFRYDISGYPTVDLVVYPDQDITVGNLNVTFRLRYLNLSATQGGAPLSVIDLSTITWSPCTLAGCSTTGSNTSAFGRPSARFIEGDRVHFLAVTGVWNNQLRLTLRFWLSGDFDEDTNWDHVFLMPSAVKIDVSVVPLSNAVAIPAPYVSLDALLAVPMPGQVASTVAFVPVAPTKTALEYNPQNMFRYTIGTQQDVANYQGGYLSWAAASSYQVRCFTEFTGTCVTTLDQDPTAISNRVFCRSTDATLPPECQNFLRPNQQGYLFRWNFNQALNTTTMDALEWYLNLGYVDPAVGAAAESAASVHSVVLAFIFAAVVALLSL